MEIKGKAPVEAPTRQAPPAQPKSQAEGSPGEEAKESAVQEAKESGKGEKVDIKA